MLFSLRKIVDFTACSQCVTSLVMSLDCLFATLPYHLLLFSRSHVYNSCENLETSAGFYNRSPLSSTSLKKTSSGSPPSGFKILSLLRGNEY